MYLCNIVGETLIQCMYVCLSVCLNNCGNWNKCSVKKTHRFNFCNRFWLTSQANNCLLVKAPSSMELMTRNLDQFLEELTLDFFTALEDFLDSSSEDEKSETSVCTLLRVPSELLLFCFVLITESYKFINHVPIRHRVQEGDMLLRITSSVMPGIHG